MSETGDFESSAPSEDLGSVSEATSEQASQRFATSQAAGKAQQKEEKKAKKRDTGVAGIILQFLTDSQRTHLATLISRLVAKDCPSTFILAVLSLISEGAAKASDEYLGDQASSGADHETALNVPESALSGDLNVALSVWITRMDRTLQKDHETVVPSLLLDEQNIDGTILQLCTFVLDEYLSAHNKKAEFEKLQLLASGILQSLFEPFVHAHIARLETIKTDEDDEDED